MACQPLKMGKMGTCSTGVPLSSCWKPRGSPKHRTGTATLAYFRMVRSVPKRLKPNLRFFRSSFWNIWFKLVQNEHIRPQFSVASFFAPCWGPKQVPIPQSSFFGDVGSCGTKTWWKLVSWRGVQDLCDFTVHRVWPTTSEFSWTSTDY